MGYAAILGLGALGSTTLAEYDLACRTWRYAGYGDYPFKLPFYERNIRPHMRSPDDIIVVTEAALLGDRGGWGGVTESLARRYHDALMEGQEAYASAKGEAMADDRWPGLFILHGGAIGAANQLNRMGATVCVFSGIDRDLLYHAMLKRGLGIDSAIRDDAEVGIKSWLMELAGEGFEPGMAVVYDDRRKRLEALKDGGFDVVASREGHDHPMDLAGIRHAKLEDFPKMLGEVLGI